VNLTIAGFKYFHEEDIRERMFITPAGLNSLHEALWYGVPMVAVPQHYEQLHNAEAMARGGAGIVLDAEVTGGTVSPKALRAAVDAVEADLAGYKARAAMLGQSLKDAGGYQAAATRIEGMIKPARRSVAVQPGGAIREP